MYIAAGIFLLLSIFGTAEIAYDYINQTERVRGYNIEDFDNDFQNGDYGNLLKKTAYKWIHIVQTCAFQGSTLFIR